MTKVCTGCHIEKPADTKHFFHHKGCKFGLDSACRKCRRVEKNRWKNENSERVNERRRQLYTEKNRERYAELERMRWERLPYHIQARCLMSGIRDRSRKLGQPFSPEFTIQFIEAWLRRQAHCECCGVEFHIGRKGDGSKNDRSPSIDRFNSSIGYELTNTFLICWRCNNIKRNYDATDLMTVARWIKNKTRKIATAA